MAHLFVDDLTVIDCSVLDPERGLIGASWIVSVELIGRLDQQSMVLDFAKVKKRIKALIDETVDHKLLVPSQHRGYELHCEDQNAFEFSFQTHGGENIKHSSHRNAITLIECEQIGITEITDYLVGKIMPELPGNVDSLHLNLREEAIEGAHYTYSHGLKKHDGNCQRIAHGHRSQIKIWSSNDKQRNADLENQIANQWRDIYLGSKEDIESETEHAFIFSYTCEQGFFRLSMPKNRCYIMPNDSTVECIAEYLAERLSKEQQQAIKVQAFEGVKKGAIHQTA